MIGYRQSNPPSEVIWLVNGQESAASDYASYVQDAGTVTVSNITVSPMDITFTKHQIVVQCIARNDEGMASKQHLIRVLCKFFLKSYIS